jgi:two-component system response regulator YesN
MECEPNLVLTDFSMPKLDGIKLANWLHDHFPACHVIVMSGQAAQLGRYAACSPPITLLQKPLTASEILTSVQRALAISGKSSSPMEYR